MDMTDKPVPPLPQQIAQQFGVHSMSKNITQPAEFYKWGLNIGDILDEIEHSLQGQFWNNSTKQWEIKGIVLMNDKGVNFISTQIRGRLGRHTAMTHMEADQIDRMTLEVCEDVADTLEDKWRDFGVEITYLDSILNLVDHVVFSNLRRSYLGGERAFIKEIAPDERRVVNNSQGSILPPFFGGSKQ